MSAITFTTLNYTGSADADDILAARREVNAENQRRLATSPPGTPLPFATGPELKSSYLTLRLAGVTAAHLAAVDAAKAPAALQDLFTTAQLQQITANIMARANAGESAAAIVADTAA